MFLLLYSVWYSAISPLCLLTFADGSGAAGLRQSVPLTHRTAEAHVHEALRGGRQRSSAWQQDSRATSQQRANFLKHQPGRVNVGQIREEGNQGIILKNNNNKNIILIAM